MQSKTRILSVSNVPLNEVLDQLRRQLAGSSTVSLLECEPCHSFDSAPFFSCDQERRDRTEKVKTLTWDIKALKIELEGHETFTLNPAPEEVVWRQTSSDAYVHWLEKEHNSCLSLKVMAATLTQRPGERMVHDTQFC